MTAYVALLRGINVGGAHKVPMADLRALFEDAGHRDVATYIQSGNVVFNSDASEADLATTLPHAIEARFGFAVPVVLRSAAELAAIAEAHPLASPTIEERFLHVTAFATPPTTEAIAAFDLTRFAPDTLVVQGRDAYVAYPSGSGRSKLTLDVIERALGAPATARNWRTINKLVEMTSAIA